MPEPAAKHLSLEDAARATGLTVKAIRRRIERGTLDSILVGGRRRIELVELLRRGLLVGLDADLRGRPPAAPRPAGTTAQRLAALEARVAALEERLAALGE